MQKINTEEITKQRKSGWVLWHLHHNGPSTANEIAEAVDCDPSYMTTLWREGLLKRRRKERDRAHGQPPYEYYISGAS